MMKRDDVIKQIATFVGGLGEDWTVDLKNPDVIILVDIYRNVLGMSVVDAEYEKLKRFNLAEIYEPTPKEQRAKNGSKHTEEQFGGKLDIIESIPEQVEQDDGTLDDEQRIEEGRKLDNSVPPRGEGPIERDSSVEPSKI